MGAVKEWLYGFYEPLYDEFGEKNGREPSDEEEAKLWGLATEKANHEAEGRADAASGK